MGEKQVQYCCNRMNLAAEDKDNPVRYNPIFREYCVKLIPNAIIAELINACPWCGYKFPKPLIEQFFEIVETEYGIEDGYLEIFKNKKLPKEFHSDEWWKKRKL